LMLNLFPKLRETDNMNEKRPRRESEKFSCEIVPKDIICKMCMFHTLP
jgi:hypothetical protein